MQRLFDPFVWMPASTDPTSWTRQPGNAELFMKVDVLGPGPKDAAPVAPEPTEEQRLATAPVCSFPTYPFQNECVRAVEKAYVDGMKAPLIVLPCGSGKTIISAAIMQRSMSWSFRAYRDGLRSGTLFIAHRKELLDQTVEKVRLVASELRVGVVQASRDEMGRDVTVASIQTLTNQKRLDAIIQNGPYHLIVCDEAHHAVSTQWKKVLDKLRAAFPETVLLGMTATPGRADGTALDDVFDGVPYSKTMEWMINHGYLVKPTGLYVRLNVDLDKIESDGGDFVQSQLSKVMNTEPVNLAVVRAWMEHGRDAKMLAFCVDVEHVHALALAFRDEGIEAEGIDGAMKAKDRQAALDRFRSGATRILTNCEISIEGYDDPSTEGVLIVRPTQSQTLHIQAIGRGLRRFPGKTDCVVLDCVGNTTRHRLAQLATIAGFDPDKDIASDSKHGPLPPWMLPPEDDAEVIDANAEDVREIDLTGHLSTTHYKWCQTTSGFALRIPRVGYYLVTIDDDEPTKAHVKFFDRRKDREHGAPRHVVGPIDTETAYTLVEADMDRLRRASDDADWWSKRDGNETAAIERQEQFPTGLVDFGDGVDFVPDSLLLKDQSWHGNPMTPKQEDLLRKLGMKAKSMPDTAGEASELIDVLQMEKDIRGSEKATAKQLWYLRLHQVTIPRGSTLDTLTKAQSSRLIVGHKVQHERRRAAS